MAVKKENIVGFCPICEKRCHTISEEDFGAIKALGLKYSVLCETVFYSHIQVETGHEFVFHKVHKTRLVA